MKTKLVFLSLLSFTLAALVPAWSQTTSDPSLNDLSSSGVENLSKPNGEEPPMLGIHWTRGFNPHPRAAANFFSWGRSPLMTYHKGKILGTAVTENIFWGTRWSTSPGDKITGLDTWYQGFSNSHYSATSDEYTGTNGQVDAATNHLGHVIDPSVASGGNSTSAILAEVCKTITPDPSGNGYYSVLHRSATWQRELLCMA